MAVELLLRWIKNDIPKGETPDFTHSMTGCDILGKDRHIR